MKYFVYQRKFSHRESEDSGMCTMTTEGTQSLQQSKHTKDAVKKSSSAVTVAAMLKEHSSYNLSQESCNLDPHSSHHNARSPQVSYLNQFSHKQAVDNFDHESVRLEGNRNGCGSDSGGDSDGEQYDSGFPALLPQKKHMFTSSRCRSR